MQTYYYIMQVLHASIESEPAAIGLTAAFYVSVTFTNTFVLLALFLAVIANTFQASAGFEKGLDMCIVNCYYLTCSLDFQKKLKQILTPRKLLP